MYLGIDKKTFHWVDTEESLERVSQLLDSQIEFAVDLEVLNSLFRFIWIQNHSYRSFQGFVCLMQISTRNDDYIIDTLALRSKMHILNNSFTNPNIVKVSVQILSI